MSEPTSFPLVWPSNWPRSTSRGSSLFKTPDLAKAVNKIEHEVGKLGAKTVIISTNLKPALSGKPLRAVQFQSVDFLEQGV